MNARKKRMGVVNWIIFVVLLVYSLSMILLYLWGVFTSLKTRLEFIDNRVWMPLEPTFNNYVEVWKMFYIQVRNTKGQLLHIDIFYQLVYTLLTAGLGAFVATLVPCCTAYLASKFQYFFSKIVYTFVLVSMVIPIIGSQPSMLVFLKNTGLYDNYFGFVLMKANFLGMYFLVFYASFLSISREFSEAAEIDGASELIIMFKVIIPLVSTTFATVFLLQFIAFWNDYQTPLIYMPTHPTLAYGVYYMANSTENKLSYVTYKMATCMLTSTPILILFILLRNRIMGNITMGGVKE